MNSYFGRSWPINLYDGLPRSRTPLGESCLYCQEPIAAGDNGFIGPIGLQNRPDLAHRPIHLACQVALMVGPAGRQQGQGLFGAHASAGHSGPVREPAGLSRRAAAIATAREFFRHGFGVGDEMRDEKVLDDMFGSPEPAAAPWPAPAAEPRQRRMKLVVTSDLHGQLPKIPDCDLLLIAGDVCPVDDHAIDAQRTWLNYAYRLWLNDRQRVRAKRVVWIAGNHDFALELGGPGRKFIREVPQATYLQDSGVEVGGLRIWGTPWSVEIGGWAFGLPDFADEGEPSLERAFARIPDDCDVVLVHGPPAGVGDRTASGQRVGSEALWRRLVEVKPRLTVFGHIHEAAGQWQAPWGGQLVNASLLDERYRVANAPVVIEL